MKRHLSEERFERIKTYIDEHYEEPQDNTPVVYEDAEAPDIQNEKTPHPIMLRGARRALGRKPMKAASLHLREDSAAFTGMASAAASPAPSNAAEKRSLKDVVSQVSETFQESLFRRIDERGMKDQEVYKSANLDKKLFSKIRKNRDYHPSKNTALALSVALHLTLDETKDLIGRAGYAFSPSEKFDLIIRFYIEEENYDIFEINEALYDFEQPLLGGN